MVVRYRVSDRTSLPEVSMAKSVGINRQELQRLARLGAEERLRALVTEIELIYQHFPELRRSGTASAAPPKARRGRRGMSAAERREVSQRMKKYWAARRKSKKSRSAAA
jgi:hypothetical protein